MIDGSTLALSVAGIAVKAAALVAVAFAITSSMKKAPAALRHLVWTLALTGVLVLPTLIPFAPIWHVPAIELVGPVATRGAEAPAASPEEADGTVAEAIQVSTQVPEPQVADLSAGPADPLRASPGPVSVSAVPVDAAAERATAGVGQDNANPPRETPGFVVPLRDRFEQLLIAGWSAGALAVLGMTLLGLSRVRRLGRRASGSSGARLSALVEEARRALGVRRSPRLALSPFVRVPITWGVLRPTILLPAEAERWSTDRLRAVMLHELAHVKRKDHAIQLLARAAAAVHWYNPLVWLAVRRLRAEAELACDDAVLRSGSRPSDYAEHLLKVARSLKRSLLPSPAGVAMAGASDLPDRLEAILDRTRDRRAVGRRALAVAGTLAVLLLLGVAGAAPGRAASFEGRPVGTTGEGTNAVADGRDRPGSRPRAPAREGSGVNVAEVIGSVGTSTSPIRPRRSAQGAPLCDWSRRGTDRNSTSMQVNDDEMRIRIERDDCRLEIDAAGELEFAPDDGDIVSVSRRGYLEVEERVDRERRRLEVRSDGDGDLERRWFVNGEAREYDAAARAWFAGILPVIFRETGFNAEARARRILARSGVEGLLQEIGLIGSDHVARKYYTVLLEEADLEPDQLRRILVQAGEQIGSDHQLAELLIGIADRQPFDDAVQAAYVEAARTLGSDHQQARALGAVLGRSDLTPEVALGLLAAATEIGSDHQLGELLIEFAEVRPLDEELTGPFFEAVETIGSDHQQRRVLEAILRTRSPDTRVLDLVLASAARGVGSDHQLAELLVGVADLYPVDRSIPAAYLEAARTIGSDHTLGRVLRRLIDRGDLTDTALTDVLEMALGIGSDHEMARLLVTVADRYTITEEVRPAFLRALDTVGSRHERERVLSRAGLLEL